MYHYDNHRIISKQSAYCYYNNVKVGGTYISTTAHYKQYKIFYNDTIFYRLTWGYNAAEKQRNDTTPK